MQPKAKVTSGGTVKRSPRSPTTHLYSQSRPVGVAGLITPWNFPIAIASWKMAPALAAGNTVVLKPRRSTGNHPRARGGTGGQGIPDGVVNFVTGPGEECQGHRLLQSGRGLGLVHG